MKKDVLLDTVQGLESDSPIDIRQAAKYLNVSVSWMYKLTHLKKVGYYKPNGKKIYFRREDLDRFVYQNRIDSQEEVDEAAVAHLSESCNPGRRVA